MNDFSNLCIHSITTKPWTLAQAIDGYTKAGVPAITVWRQHLEPYGALEAGKMLRGSGLKIVSLCRGGFFPADTKAGHIKALDDNRRAIDQAAAIGAPLVVLVCGALPGMPLAEARKQILEGIAAILPHAEPAGIKLAIEPLHPMYAADRSAINTLKQANDMAETLAHRLVGVAVDVYHVWWDPELPAEIQRAGKNIFAFHVSDWRTPTRDILNDRTLMGNGCINIREIRGWVESAGFSGYTEVEIFSETYWATSQTEFVEKIKTAYREHV